MAEYIPESEKDKDFERINGIADYVIDILKKLDAEYDSLIEIEKKRLESDGRRCEVKKCKNSENEYCVHDVVGQGISICDQMRRQWEEHELSVSKLAEIQEMQRVFQKEKHACEENKSHLERRLNIEQNKIDSLNEIIENFPVVGDDIHNKEQQLKAVMDELENLSVQECIYPTAILEFHSACNDLQERLESMERELLKYADLPPDYNKAREKLAEAQLRDKELQRLIRNFVK